MENLSLRQWCEEYNMPELLAQWHPTKNTGETPDTVLSGSHKKVWWKDALGHEWAAQVRTRVNGGECPYCAGREVWPGFNDLASNYPDLAGEWHPDKNGPLTPEQVSCGTRRKVWWQCARGHQWRATILSRTDGAGCPYCANRVVVPGENDFASMRPDLAAEWHPEKNGPLRPDQVMPQSNRRVWWLCPRGHAYRMPVANRVSYDYGCPYCSGRKVLAGFNDLETVEPMVAAEWHPTLNGGLKPSQVTRGSRKRVWWQCTFGHSWQAVVYSRTAGRRSGCPVCAGKVSAVKGARSKQIMTDLTGGL